MKDEGEDTNGYVEKKIERNYKQWRERKRRK